MQIGEDRKIDMQKMRDLPTLNRTLVTIKQNTAHNYTETCIDAAYN